MPKGEMIILGNIFWDPPSQRQRSCWKTRCDVMAVYGVEMSMGINGNKKGQYMFHLCA